MLGRAFAWSGAALFAASLVYFIYRYFVAFGSPAESDGWVAPSLINAVLFSIFALHHSVFARTWARAIVARTVPPHLERACYTWASSLLFIGVCRLWQPVPGLAYQLVGPWWWLGMAAQAAGLAITCLGTAAVDPLDLAGIRQVQDARGAPALRTTGVHRVVRHPIYFGWALVVFGAPTMTATRLVFAIVSTAYLAIAIPLEERGLVGTFGQEYDEYRRQVRWRMIPGVY